MSETSADPRRALPSVSALLEMAGVRALLARAPRTLVVEAAREVVDLARREPARRPRDASEWTSAIDAAIARAGRASLRPVLNGTGVVLHTNLGRAPIADAAIEAIARVARGFSNLEYDVEAGARGSRYVHCAGLLRELTDADDAIVVNNCAAALVLTLNTLADGRDAIISRGELVEIGGSFRIPDIMRKSGARLVEIGTTNRTHAEDYARALHDSPAAGAILKVHRSNFAVEGFVAEATAADLSALARAAGVPIVHDLGSGLLLPLDAFGLVGEPTARDALRAGASVVTMSGDKLLGGPQAGIILGNGEVIEALRRNPLARAFRVDKLTLAALEATLALYREPDRARREIPALAMLTADVPGLRLRATSVQRGVSTASDAVRLVDSEASVGGGAFPTARIPSAALSIGGDAVGLERRLRLGEPAVIARLVDGRLLIDLRTILPRDDAALVSALAAALHDGS